MYIKFIQKRTGLCTTAVYLVLLIVHNGTKYGVCHDSQSDTHRLLPNARLMVHRTYHTDRNKLRVHERAYAVRTSRGTTTVWSGELLEFLLQQLYIPGTWYTFQVLSLSSTAAVALRVCLVRVNLVPGT